MGGCGGRVGGWTCPPPLCPTRHRSYMDQNDPHCSIATVQPWPRPWRGLFTNSPTVQTLACFRPRPPSRFRHTLGRGGGGGLSSPLPPLELIHRHRHRPLSPPSMVLRATQTVYTTNYVFLWRNIHHDLHGPRRQNGGIHGLCQELRHERHRGVAPGDNLPGRRYHGGQRLDLRHARELQDPRRQRRPGKRCLARRGC